MPRMIVDTSILEDMLFRKSVNTMLVLNELAQMTPVIAVSHIDISRINSYD
jgi:hypothetical protein